MNQLSAGKLPVDPKELFAIAGEQDFLETALRIFRYQFDHNPIYSAWCKATGVQRSAPDSLTNIPYLPISFFKTHEVRCHSGDVQQVFYSSGTASGHQSRHFVEDMNLYNTSLLCSFEHFFGTPENFCILALLPSYCENPNSSLIHMTNKLIGRCNRAGSGFVTLENIRGAVKNHDDTGTLFILGVSYALLDLAEMSPPGVDQSIVVETGGMKGRRSEITKTELHERIKRGLGVRQVCSEYGMTELLSQAWSKGNGIFQTPAWMKVIVRDPRDPFSVMPIGSGALNIIDLANLHSCSFIATDDTGIAREGGFELTGRITGSEIRGCNLLIE